MGDVTLHDIIIERSMLPPEQELAAWKADRARAEAVYLATIRLCDERAIAAAKRMDFSKEPTNA